MNISATIVGILAALLALALVVVATAAGALLSLVQSVAAPVRTTSKPTSNSTETRSGKDVEAVKMPQGRRSVEEFRSAA